MKKKLITVVKKALADLKAREVLAFDVRKLTGITDTCMICTGTSNRHVKAIANSVHEAAKKAGIKTVHTEGEASSEWILMHFGDIMVHIMQPEVREFYQLEKLWDTGGNAL